MPGEPASVFGDLSLEFFVLFLHGPTL